jgi:sugar/nucleoside kinase (ribokinase family)
MTLGADGTLARFEGKFHYTPGYVINCIDTTGAGDVFHGAFCYSVITGMSLPDALDFSCAMAALNCTQLGARGGIATAAEARALMASAERRVWSEASRV